MGLLGQVGAGAGFLGVGLWQAFMSAKAYRLGEAAASGRSSRASLGQSSNRCTEHAAVAILAALHMAAGLVCSQSQNNGPGVGAAFALERFGVAAVFFLYAAVAILSEGTAALPLPAGMVELMAMIAFGEEFSLFYLTSGDAVAPPGLETQYYSLLLVPIAVCLAATAVGIAQPAAALAPVVRSLGLVLQGTWFFQMAVSLYSRKWMAKGCTLLQTADGVHTVRCDDGMSLMRGRALATLQFNCHLALLLLVLLPAYGFLCKVVSAPANYERLDQSQATEEVIELDVGRENGRELAQSTYIHAEGGKDHENQEAEEEVSDLGEVHSKDGPDVNGFHRVNI